MGGNVARALLAVVLSCGCSGKAPGPSVMEPQEVAGDPAEQVPVPAGSMIEGELRFTMSFSVDFEHGCSQSMEGKGARGSFVLAVGKDDAATLTMQLHESYVTGPSFGAYEAEGGGEFYHQSWDELTTWSGHAKRSGKSLTVTFFEAAVARVAQPQYGTVELSDPTLVATSLSMRCRTGTVQAYPPSESEYFVTTIEDGQETSEVPALLCEGMQESLDWWGEDLGAAEGKMPFGPGAGIVVGVWTFYYSRDVIIRQGS
jgi:hypothetical protein